MSTAVKYIHSGMAGAPVLSGSVGAMIAVLDACLVNGFGSATVDSVVVSSNVATVTRAAGHPFEVGSVAELSGATPSGLNGQKKVVSVTSTSYTFATSGIADVTATGTISHKVAGLGWAKEFSGTNLAVYKSIDVASTACRLRVDDTGTTSARILGYETMTDVNTGTGRFPTELQLAGGYFWPKSNLASTSARAWTLVGDGRLFYLHLSHYLVGSSSYSATHAFGDFTSKRSPDPYACLLFGHRTYLGATSGAPGVSTIANSSTTTGGHYMPRAYTGLGSSRAGHRHFVSPFTAATGSTVESGNGYMQYPNPTDNGLYVAPMVVTEFAPNTYRGDLPGLYFVPMDIGTAPFTQGERVTGVSGLPGKTLRAFISEYGPAFVDTTGPWR